MMHFYRSRKWADSRNEFDITCSKEEILLLYKALCTSIFFGHTENTSLTMAMADFLTREKLLNETRDLPGSC
jgi:hypothetical protein